MDVKTATSRQPGGDALAVQATVVAAWTSVAVCDHILGGTGPESDPDNLGVAPVAKSMSVLQGPASVAGLSLRLSYPS